MTRAKRFEARASTIIMSLFTAFKEGTKFMETDLHLSETYLTTVKTGQMALETDCADATSDDKLVILYKNARLAMETLEQNIKSQPPVTNVH